MVALTTDHGFRIGMPHVNQGLPCQDYALSGVSKTGVAYAAVADGCSSGRDTDIGARVIARASVPDEISGVVPLDDLTTKVRMAQMMAMRVTIPAIRLEVKDLIATSVLAVITPQDGGLVYLRGDGMIVLEYADGRVHAITFEPEGNAPVYPAYALEDYAGVKARFGSDDSVDSLRWRRFALKEAEPELLEQGVLSLGEAYDGFTLALSPEDVQGLRYVAVFTDGVMQVNGVDWQDSVRQLMAFKGTAGRFVVRRLNRFVQTAAQDGKGLMDDLGYAVIQIAPDPEPQEVCDGDSQRIVQCDVGRARQADPA